jgi:starch synthase (maltosyl-transferring)
MTDQSFTLEPLVRFSPSHVEERAIMGPQRMLIYNLFPPLAGPFSRWKEHFPRIREMGFNWIFVNPIQEPGMSGSIYAIRDYFNINPVLCDSTQDTSPEEQVTDTVEAAEKAGLRLMIDLVINHCSIDSPLLKEHPEWFEWGDKGEVAHPHAHQDGKKVVWGDLARFDYRKRKDLDGLFRYFLNLLRHLIHLGFRGFRCDAAYQIPPEIWKRLIMETKESDSDVLFLAETLGCTPKETKKTARAGFDYIFNSSKWWDYKSHWLMNQYNLTRDMTPSIGFPESHDTNRLYQELDGNLNGVKQRYLFTALFSSGVMIPMGFEFGFRKKPDVAKTTPADWENTEIDLTPFIQKVNRIKETCGVFQEEAATQMHTEGNPQVLMMWKGASRTDQEALVLINKDIRNPQCFKTPDIYDFFESKALVVDVSPENPLREIPEQLSFDLAPGEGKVLVTKEEA